MIHRAKFQNFKALRDIEVTFDSRLTVLVGPNGSGKTSVLEGIEFVSAASPYSRRVNGQHFRTRDIDFEIIGQRASTGTQVLDVVIELTHRWPDGGRTQARIARSEPQELTFGVPPPALTYSYEDYGPDEVQRSLISGTRSELSPARMLCLDVRKLASPSQITSKPPIMTTDGEGLASTLWYLMGNQPEQYAGIVSAVQQVVPTIERLRFDVDQRADFRDEVLFDFRGAPGIRAVYASTGTLLTLGLLTAILGPERPRIVLLDDIDNGLHPKAQKELVEVLRKILAQYPDLQIIATTHSLYILHWLEFNEVRLLTLNDEGATVCGRLDEHPDYERWKNAMTPGEFWTHVGEDWLLKKQPEPVGAAS